MGILDDIMADDMANAFLDTDTFAEAVIYTPVGGSPITINALVDRDPPEDDSQTVRPKMLITVANKATTGILSSALNTGGDTITVAYRKGDTASDYLIKRYSGPNAEDSACLRLELH